MENENTVVVGTRVIPRVLDYVAETRSRELFTLTVLVIALGIAVGSALVFSVSTLGAFLAGMVVGRSEYSLRAASEALPMRDAFAVLFFVSVGMLLDPLRKLVERPAAVGFLLLAIVVGKFLAVIETAILLRLGLRGAVLSGAALAHVGEFSFVLAGAAQGKGILDADLEADLLTASALSMLLAPLLMAFSPRLAEGALRVRWLTRLLDVRPTAEARSAAAATEGHVIIAGYGVAGEELSRSLKACAVPYVVVDLNPTNVHKAASHGEPAFFGED